MSAKKNLLLTWLEQHNGFQTCILCRINISSFKLVDRFLKQTHCCHDVNNFLGWCGVDVQSCR